MSRFLLEASAVSIGPLRAGSMMFAFFMPDWTAA